MSQYLDVKYIDEIKANLKAIIKSSKDGLLLSVIEKDYANMVGEPIPYHQLGFNYLIEFIRFIGDFNVKAQRFDYLITLSKNVKTKHLDDTNSKQKILNKVFSSIVIKSRASHQHERSEVPKQSEHMPKPSNDVNTKGKASTWKKRPLLKNTEDKIAKKNSDEEKVLGNIIKYIDLEAIIYEKYPKDCKLSSIDDSDMFIILDFIQNNIGQLEYRINALDGKWKKCSDFSTNLNIVHPTEFQQLQRFLDQLDARVKDLEEKKRSNSACIHKKIRRNSNMVCDALLEQNTHDQIQDSQEPKKNEIEIVAIGCKIIVVIPGRIKCTLYRVSIVDSGGETIYDKYIKPQQTFTDYRMALSGIRRKDIENGECFATVKQEVTLILKDKLLVGHSIQSILNVLHILHPPHMIRDITSYYKFKQFGQPCELKKLALDFLGIKLQNGEHSSVEHANVALQLYMLVQLDWESIFKK